jgi:glycosyltransferase involved in cell wall biosynthesis
MPISAILAIADIKVAVTSDDIHSDGSLIVVRIANSGQFGSRLSEAYANMDLFVFPSQTDTFGNVIQEAAASGVPAIVTCHGGPQHLVRPGITGFVAENDQQFLQRILEAAVQPERMRLMGEAARENIREKSWDTAFEMTYNAYRYCQQATAASCLVHPKPGLSRPQVPAA